MREQTYKTIRVAIQPPICCHIILVVVIICYLHMVSKFCPKNLCDHKTRRHVSFGHTSKRLDWAWSEEMF